MDRQKIKLFADNLTRLVSGLEKANTYHQIYKPRTNERVHRNAVAREPHYHESWELKIPMQGTLRCRFEKQILDVKSHAVLLIAPRSIHYETAPSDLRRRAVLLNCVFENGDIHLMLMGGRRLTHYFFSSDQKSELTALLGQSANEFFEHIAWVLERVDRETSQKIAGKWLYLFFLLLLKAFVSAPVSSPKQEIVSRAIALLNNMFQDTALTVECMAKMLNISPKYLSAVFCRLTGIPLRQKLIRIRLENALRQLQTGRFTVKEVAAFTGWQNQFYFSNAFRRHYGISPSQVSIRTQ